MSAYVSLTDLFSLGIAIPCHRGAERGCPDTIPKSALGEFAEGRELYGATG